MTALARLIEDWFEAHEGDGDFAKYPRSVPYSVIHPMGASGRIIYATKPCYVATAFAESEVPDDFGLVGRFGLPSQADANWIRGLVGSGRLLFLGDMDPVDLLVFAWLRDRIGVQAVIFVGVHDELLSKLQIDLVEPLTLHCSRGEQGAIEIVKSVVPDVQTIVGPQCANLLDHGRKIELDAVVSSVGSPAAAIRLLFDAR